MQAEVEEYNGQNFRHGLPIAWFDVKPVQLASILLYALDQASNHPLAVCVRPRKHAGYTQAWQEAVTGVVG